MKYIVYEQFGGLEVVILFPQFLEHKDVAYVLTSRTKLVSAGFVKLINGEFHVSGKSTSLNLSSRPEDTDLIISHLTFEGI